MRIRVTSLQFASNCVGVCHVPATAKKHPNKLPFEGVLLLVDSSSDQPPTGAEGHRIFVSKKVAQRRLSSLIGTALNYTRSLDGHALRRKVGVITGAWIDGNKVKVAGHIWKKDFPEAVRDLRGQGLGMSMELADVYVQDRHADVWVLEDFYFTGATALLQESAAYYKTALAAARAALGVDKGGAMATEKKKKQVDQGSLLAAAIAAGIGPAVQAAITAAFKPLAASMEAMLKAQEETKKAMEEDRKKKSEDEMESEGHDEEEEDEEEVDAQAAAEEDDDEEEDEMESEGHDEDEDDEEEVAAEGLEDMHTGEKAVEEEVGKINKDAESKGSKTSVSARRRKKKMKYPMHAAVPRKGFSIMAASLRKEKKHRRKLEEKVETLTSQVELYAERQERRTITPELRHLLEKAGHDVGEIASNAGAGQKIPVAEFDRILSDSGLNLPPTERMRFKNELYAAGYLDEGKVVRAWSN